MKIAITLCALLLSGGMLLKAEDAPKKAKKTPEEMFKSLDKNGDGFLSKEEFLAGPAGKKDPAKAEERYKKMDKKGDGKVTLEEFTAAMTPKKKDK